MICSTVNVAVRIRPLASSELENGSKTCVGVVQGKEKIQVVGSEKSYRFDHVFGSDIDNESFYNSVMRNKVAEVFNDRDVTILAYGQRSSGKTHTMGTNYTGEENMGIIPRAIDTLFNIINSNDAHKYKVTVTFTELYNKKLYDLLASNKEGTERIVKLQKNGSKVFGLTESQVTNVNTALQCLVEGSRKRMTSEKKGNSQSTRSHAIFTITIYQRKNVDPRITTTSKLHFVDLSGSKHDKKNGKKVKENKDLLAIRNWINHERKGKSDSYTKYQSSKLAILLRDSLRGNSMIVFIACVTPAGYCLVETLRTLRYASRLRKIKRDIRANQTNVVGNEIATKMDRNLIDKPNLINGLEVQQSASNMDVQESGESETNDKIKAHWIPDPQDLNNCSRSEQENWFQREMDIETENSQKIIAAWDLSKFNEIKPETFQEEVDEDWEEKLIQDALKSNEVNTIEQQKFQRETEDDIEALRILDAEVSSKCSINEQQTFQREMDDDSEADLIHSATTSSKSNKTMQGKFQREIGNDIETQRIPDAQISSKCSENDPETFESQMDDDSEAESIQNSQTSSESSEIQQDKFPRKPDEGTEVQRNSHIVETDKSSEIQHQTFQSETDADLEKESIQDAQKLSESSKAKQEEFQSLPDDDTEVQKISDALESSKSSTSEQQMVESESDDDTEAERIRDALESHKSNKYCKKMLQTEIRDVTDAERIQDALESSKSNITWQESVLSESDDNTEEQRIRDALESNKSTKYCKEIFQTEMRNAMDPEKIHTALDSSKSSTVEQEMVQSGTDEDTETENIQDGLELRQSDKIGRDSVQSDADYDTDAQSIQETLESSKSNKSKQEISQSERNDETKAQRIQDALVSNKTGISRREIVQIQMDDESDAERMQDALEFNKSSKSVKKMITMNVDDDPEVERIRDALESNKLSKTEQTVVQIEMDDKTIPQTIQKALESTKSDEFENEIDRNKTNINSDAETIHGAPEPNKFNKTEQKMFQTKVINATNPERIEAAQNVSKFGEAQREHLLTETIEDSPLNLFSKIADFFLESSPTEEKELRKEIRNLRKKLRDRTAKLNSNIMDDLSVQVDAGVSKKRRENAKLLVAKILEEFQEVLTYIVENSEIRDWIVRVFRRIRDLLNEQKEIAGKMLRCEMNEDETIDEKHAEHTIRQVNRYHELQGVNRCIALLEELVASLPKESITVRDIVRNLEDTTNQIKELENEKVDLVGVLKSSESLNDSRKLAEYGIDKVLELDEKISRLWRRRIKQMIAIERREKFNQQISNMSAQIQKLKSARVGLVEEMKNAEKQWKQASTSGERNQEQNRERTKKAKNSKVFRKCACKVLECLSRRCSCVKNGVSCTDCNCNAELCQNSGKENNTSNVSKDSQALSKISAGNDLKCACTINCFNRRCTCRKNGDICNHNCRCRPQSCKNKNKENSTTEVNFNEPQTSNGLADGKMEVTDAANSLHVNLCMCHKNSTTCTNCNRSWKLREYKAKARRRLFTDIEDSHENEGNEMSRKRPRLGA